MFNPFLVKIFNLQQKHLYYTYFSLYMFAHAVPHHIKSFPTVFHPPKSFLYLRPSLYITYSVKSSIRVFSNESTLRMRWPKYWSFSFNISPAKEHTGLISFRMDWLDLLAVQGTLKSLRQHHSSKTSIPRCSAFFTVQLSHPYMTTGKTIALTRRTFVGYILKMRNRLDTTPEIFSHLLKSVHF